MISSKNQVLIKVSHSAKLLLLGVLVCFLNIQVSAQCHDIRSKIMAYYNSPELRLNQKLALLNEVIGCCEAELLNQTPIPQKDQCAYAYYQRGNLLLAIGEFERGKADLEKAVKYFTEQNDKNDARTDIGNYHSNQGDYGASVKIYEDIIRESGLKYNFVAGLNLVDDLINLRRIGDAEIRWKQLKQIEDRLGWARYYLYELKGQLEHEKGDLEQALQNFRRAIEIATSDHGENSHLVAQCHLNLASNFYFPNGAYQEALRSYQATLQAYIPDFKPKTIYTLPSTEQLGMIDDDILQVLEGRAKTILKMYESGQSSIQRLDQALDGLSQFAETEVSLRKFFASETSSLFTIARRHEVMELAIKISHLLYQETGKSLYIDQALQFSDLSKDIVLKEDQNSKENSIKKRPREKEFISQAIDLRREYLILKTEREHLILKGKKPSRDALLAWEENNSRFLSMIQKEAEEIHNQKYSINKTNIPRIRQRLLLKNQALIEYFIGNEHSYAMVVTDRQATIIEISFHASDSLEVQACLAHLTGRGSGVRKRAFYERKAIHLYNMLIDSIKRQITLPERLMIIPDGVLSSLPFDALIQENQKNGEKRYLIEDHIISLAYSTSLMLNQPEKPSTKDLDYLGFAPIQFPNPNNNMPLSEVEVKQVRKMLGGDLLLFDKASLEELQNQSSNYRIVHLATHGTFDTRYQIPYLKLYNGEILTLSEIYLLNLDGVELVILSACESNLGRAVSGEGIMGLSRGFTYAGCYSMMSTLWNVRQKVGSPLVVNYTENLKKGMEKDRALAAAKRNFIKQAEELYQDPYFWASLVQIGNNDRLYPTSLWHKFFSFERLIYFFVALILVLWFRGNALTRRSKTKY